MLTWQPFTGSWHQGKATGRTALAWPALPSGKISNSGSPNVSEHSNRSGNLSSCSVLDICLRCLWTRLRFGACVGSNDGKSIDFSSFMLFLAFWVISACLASGCCHNLCHATCMLCEGKHRVSPVKHKRVIPCVIVQLLYCVLNSCILLRCN